jgi:hypothetical protein
MKIALRETTELSVRPHMRRAENLGITARLWQDNNSNARHRCRQPSRAGLKLPRF